MAKNKNPLDEEVILEGGDEYKYHDEDKLAEEYVAELSPPAKKRNFAGIFRSKRLWVAVLVVLSIIVVAKILQSRSHINDTIEQTSISSDKSATTTNFKPEMASTNKVIPAITEVRTTPAIENQVNQLKQYNQIEQKQLQQLRSNISTIKTDVARNEQGLKDIAISMQILAQQVQQLNNTLAQQAAKTAPVKSVPPKPVAKPITYVIKAMMPGRAWLAASNGKTLTVKAGDQINTYGMVQAVDVDRGIVLTSSGKIIRYGKNDE